MTSVNCDAAKPEVSAFEAGARDVDVGELLSTRTKDGANTCSSRVDLKHAKSHTFTEFKVTQEISEHARYTEQTSYKLPSHTLLRSRRVYQQSTELNTFLNAVSSFVIRSSEPLNIETDKIVGYTKSAQKIDEKEHCMLCFCTMCMHTT